MFEFLLKTTIPVAAGWVTLALLYDKFLKNLYTDESVYNPTSTGVKKLDKKEISKDTLKGITAAKKNSASLLDESSESEENKAEINLSSQTTNTEEDNINEGEQDGITPLLAEAETDLKNLGQALAKDRFKNSAYSTDDELAEDELNSEILTFKDDNHDDIFFDTPISSHYITI